MHRAVSLSFHDLKEITPEPLNLKEIDENSYEEELAGLGIRPINDKPYQTPIKILKTIQKYSAYSFSIFGVLHGTSVILVPAIASHNLIDDVFWLARSLYQISAFENVCIFGSLAAHILSGITLRILKNIVRNGNPQNAGIKKTRKRREVDSKPIVSVNDSNRDDVGLGGLTGILGLGYRKSWISRKTGLSPLSFSGYLLTPMVLYHLLNQRIAPFHVEGDSSLVSLQYVSHQLNQIGVHKAITWLGLTSLVWLGSYHIVAGYMKYFKLFSLKAREISYGIINGITLLSVVSLFRISKIELESEFVNLQFKKYLNFLWHR